MSYPKRKNNSQAPTGAGMEMTYYFSNSNPFYAAGLAPQPNQTSKGNCTWYAWGRYWEMSKPDSGGNRPRPSWLPTGNAGTWYEKVKDTYKVDKDQKPQVGYIAVWKGGKDGGHVAIVEQINSDGSIITSNSGWPDDYFVVNPSAKKPNYSNYYPGSYFTLQGWIKNPNLDSEQPEPRPQDTPAKVTNIIQDNQTQITINGELGGIDGITTDNILYIKWNSNASSSSNYDIQIKASQGSLANRKYTVKITKPRSASIVAVTPYQVNKDLPSYNGATFTKILIVSIPCILVSFGGTSYKQALPYVFTNGQWKATVPQLFSKINGTPKWYEIYNNKE